MKNQIAAWLLTIAMFIPNVSAQNSSMELILNTKKAGIPIQSTMYGLFFEDINFAADGGLYAEMVKNRSFEFPQTLMGWNTFGAVEVKNENPPFPNNPTYLKLSTPTHSHKHTGIENEGFRGMGFKKDATYRFSIWAKKENSSQPQKIRVEIMNEDNSPIGNQELEINNTEWTKYNVILTAGETVQKGRLRIFLRSEGAILVDHVSLFPTDTWKGRENGLRKDLAQALADTKPGVFRFPGGCIVEGTEIDERYDWKKSVGQVENRPLNMNRWHYTFTNRFFPDYFQSYGLGFYEYFLLSEDMGTEPLPVVNCGLVCQYQNNEEYCHVALDDLGNYIQDALDLIEFANGPVTSTWGKLRADMGHPEPFNLKYLGVGNEQWGSEYVERLALFVKALREKHPEIKIIGSSGPSADGEQFDYLWPEMKRLKVDLVDEHYYKDPDWFLKSAARYDNYDRKAPAVFAGEYACHVPGKDNNFRSALCEAAFMTGLERNADIVHMCTYAPLFAHVDAWQWKPDMIWFDNLSLFKTPNYYVQQLYAQHKGTHTASLLYNNKPLTGQNGLYASAVYDKDNNSYIIKIANVNPEPKEVKLTLNGLKKNQQLTLGECIQLHSDNLSTVNDLQSPTNIVPQETNAIIDNNAVILPVKGNSFGVYTVTL